MKSKKEKLREFKLSWRLLEELPDTVQEEEKHWGLRRGKLKTWECGDLKGEDDKMMEDKGDMEQGPLRRSENGI